MVAEAVSLPLILQPMPLRLLFPILLLPFFCLAQPSPETQTLVRRLTPEQKLKVLEYLRQQGVDLDKEIAWGLEQLPDGGKEKTLQMMQSMQPNSGKANRTTVGWDRDTIALGDVEEGILKIDSFRVTNTGKVAYQISEIRTSCDCTVLRKPEFPILPGDTATLRVEFDTRNKQGPTLAGIVLYDNSSPNLRNILYLKANVVPRQKRRQGF